MSIPLLEIRMDARGANETIDRLIEAASDFSVPFALFRVWHGQQTVMLFMANAQGGTYRGVSWAYFKNPVRTRKDGSPIPPWGGVPRLKAGRSNRSRDKGSRVKRDKYKSTGRETNVRAVLRASGKRLKEGDAVLQDTRRLLQTVSNASAEGAVELIKPYEIRFGTKLPYAAKQHSMRPILFFAVGDEKVLERLVLQHFLGGH